ncbi:MAG: hypothetical protein QMD80_09125 [archaeon]|nr:hypothetical protein [archaeon]
MGTLRYEKVLAKRLCDLYRIEVGEAEAIAICISRIFELFLTDDKDAREVGELYDIESTVVLELLSL